MDPLISTNRARWNALADANVEYSRPFLDYSVEAARKFIQRHGILTDVAGKEVLCLSSGGGQDSAAFGIMGAHVTVFDLSDVQLQRDQQAADHHGYQIKCLQGDMRDISILPDTHFDIVWQTYSINFVPSIEPVINGVRRVLKQDGIYFLMFANPFTMAVDDGKWNGQSYPLNGFYIDGEDLFGKFPTWDVTQPDGSSIKCDSPHEFRHALGTVLNTMVVNGFSLLGLWEWIRQDENPPAGSWPYFTQIAPPYFSTFWRLKK